MYTNTHTQTQRLVLQTPKGKKKLCRMEKNPQEPKSFSEARGGSKDGRPHMSSVLVRD